jgi:5'(3')-deoxyribonucleotidase
MVVYCDMDGVLNNWNDLFIKTIEDLGYKFDYKNYNTFSIESYILGLDNKEQKKLLSIIMEDIRWWDLLEPLPNSQTILKLLYTNSQIDLYIATSPWAEDYKYKEEKKKWLKKYFNFIPQNKIIFSSKKWELEGNVIIEDKPATLEKCLDKMITVCHTLPYNINTEVNFRFKNWLEIPKIFKKIVN